MRRYQFFIARISGVTADFSTNNGPPKTASIDFGVWANGSDGRTGQFTVRRRAILTLEKESDGQWRVTDYEHLILQRSLDSNLTGTNDNFATGGSVNLLASKYIIGLSLARRAAKAGLSKSGKPNFCVDFQETNNARYKCFEFD